MTNDVYGTERNGEASASRAPRDTMEARVKAFDAEVLPRIRAAVDTRTLRDTAVSHFDVDPGTAEAIVSQWTERYDTGIVEPATACAAATALDRYLLEHDRYADDTDALMAEAVDAAVQEVFPTYLFRDGVTKLYNGDDLHPGHLHRDVARSLARNVEELVDDPCIEAVDMLHGEPVGVDAFEEPIEAGMLHTLESGVGERQFRATWNPDHPAVTTAAADILLDDLGRQVQRFRETDPDRAAYVQEVQDAYRTTLHRLRVEETVDAMETLWGRGDLPYEVFDINDADEMLRAAVELGNCRAHERNRSYYELLADDPYTTVLGIRRLDDRQWIGAARCFHLTTSEDEHVFGIDNLGMQYRDDAKGHDPLEGCAFDEYGDALPIMGLAAMRYGLDHGFDYVVAAGGTEGDEAFPDMRVGGGPGDRIGPAHLYGQHGARMYLEKRGTRTEGEPYGFGQPRGPNEGYVVRILLENPTRL